MIFYNFDRIYRYSKGSSKEILKVIRYLTYKPTIHSRYDYYYRISLKDWSGHSFLLHPEALFSNRHKHSDLHLAQYVGLASLRNYAEYQILGKTTLDLLAFKGKEETITNNSLLRLEDGEIYFIYEEAT